MKKLFPAIAALALILTGCGEKTSDQYIFSTATIEAEQIRVASIVKGKVLKVLVDEGERVSKGQELVIIDGEEFERQKAELAAGIEELRHRIASLQKRMEQVRIKLKLLEKDYRRASHLLSRKAISLTSFEKAQAEYLSSKKKLESLSEEKKALEAKLTSVQERIALLNYYLENCRVKAPADGIVQQLLVREGEVALPASPLLVLAKMDSVWARMYVAEADLGFVKIGQKARIKVDSFPEKDFWGRVSWVSPEAEFIPKNVQTSKERATLVYAVKVEIENKEGIFKIGMPVEVYLRKK